MKKILAMLLFGFFSATASADWNGTVVGITDGDTVTVLDAGKHPVKIRLTEIDAPEKKQPFGQQSKQSLSDICYGMPALVGDKGRDRYGRTLARLDCDGLDANAEQVRRGMAWAYIKYLTDPNIAELEKSARSKKAGLWVDSTPIPPWEFRHPRP